MVSSVMGYTTNAAKGSMFRLLEGSTKGGIRKGEWAVADVRKVMACEEIKQGLEMGIGHCQRRVNVIHVDSGKSLCYGKFV